MASNPMQRKTRNSFLAGMLITVIIAGVIIAFLLLQMSKIKEEVAIENATDTVYVLTKNVQSGDVLTSADFESVSLPTAAVPGNSFSPSEYSLITNEQGEEVGSIITAKIDIEAGTTAVQSMFNIDVDPISDDMRIEEFNMITLPIDLYSGEIVDIRIAFPSGINYVVVSKKEVEIPFIGYSESPDTIRMTLTEEEIAIMQCAIVEAYQIPGTKIYANRYVEPGLQSASEVAYEVSEDVKNAMLRNPNLIASAKTFYNSKWNDSQERTLLNNTNSSYIDEDSNENIQAGMTESIVKSQEDRTEYLESMQQDIY